ncbi:MAG: TonB-dependent siderophore receptor [Luteitalea sp.]|nr:TonB-dependent siderophore receptor [Luteitalea sp.]
MIRRRNLGADFCKGPCLVLALLVSALPAVAMATSSGAQIAPGSRAAPCTVSAGEPARTLSGVVADAQGARVADATVTAECGTFTRQDQTASDGAFSLELPAGTYEVRVERSGFDTFYQQIIVAPDRDAELSVALTVAHITDAVTVSASSGVVTRSRTATKTNTPLIETPQSISVITREQIEAQNTKTMEAVVRYTAGVRAEMYGPDNRGDWFTLRGGSEGSTLLDGLRLPLSGWYGNVRNEPYAFEQVEVLRGPSSVLYGQNGPGGVVNLVSKKPQAVARRDISVQLGNHAHKQLALDFTGPLNANGSLLYRLVAVGKDSGTQVNYADEERQFVAPSLTWRPSATTFVNLYGQYQRDESNNTVGFFPWEGTLLPASNGRIPDDTFIGEPDWDTYGGDRTRLGYQFDHQLNDTWSIRHNLRYDDVSGHLRGMYANYWEGFLDDGRAVNRTWYATRTDTRITNADVLTEGKLTLGRTRHTVLLGVDGLWSRDVNPTVGGDATPLDLYAPVYGTFPLPELEFDSGDPTRTRQIGMTVQDQIKFDERWVLVAGLRYDSADVDVEDSPAAGADNSAWTHRVGAVYLAAGGWAPYASYSTSFEVFTGSDFYGVPFKPKRGEQWEGGVKWSPLGERLVFTAAAYTLDEKNRPTTDPDNPLNQVQQGEVTVNGAELEATARLPAWDLVGNYTYADAKITASSEPDDPYLNKRLHSIPEHSASLWAVHKFSLRGIRGLNAGLGVRYVGESWDGTDVLATPSTTLVDAMFSFDHGPWRYAVNASNLFDKLYIATCIDRGDCWYGNRRRVAVTAGFRY